MNQRLKEKLKKAALEDSDILSDRASMEETLGSDAKYLEEVLGLTKSDLLRLEREGLAVKARYSTANKRWYYDEAKNKVSITGPHRIRYIIFKEAIA